MRQNTIIKYAVIISLCLISVSNVFSQNDSCNVYLAAIDYVRNYTIWRNSMDTIFIDIDTTSTKSYYIYDDKYFITEIKRNLEGFLNNPTEYLTYSAEEDSCFKCNLPFLINDTLKGETFLYPMEPNIIFDCLQSINKLKFIQKDSDWDDYYENRKPHKGFMSLSDILFIDKKYAHVLITIRWNTWLSMSMLLEKENGKWKVIRSALDFIK